MDNLRQKFLLDPSITFLNHGSFGACPMEVFERYQGWQKQLEKQPVLFLGREIKELMQAARDTLGDYFGVQGDDLVYFTNPTTALNMVVRGLALETGAEILATSHEYGALNRTWDYYANLFGANYIQRPFTLPVDDPAAWVEEFWEGVTPQTKVIFISHITSPTALTLPVEAICRRASAAGILTIVDGAHAPGQLDLNLERIGADIYAGALHKWFCAPKGAAFIYIHRQLQDNFDPLVVSWGYESEEPTGSRFVDYHEWQGTRDMSAFLSVPAAIEFQKQNNWPALCQRAHQLATRAREKLLELDGFKPLSKPFSGKNAYRWFAQMFAVQLPDCPTEVIQERLYNHYRIEVPVYRWQGIPLIRISIQAYNTSEDIDHLVEALVELQQQSYFKK